MTGQDLQKLLPGETLDFHVWSSPKNIPAYDYDFWSSKDYDGYRQRNMTLHLDKKIDNNKDMLKAWAHMARADILIMSQSSFSMVPALLGLVVWVHLWVTLWQEVLVPQPEWFSNSVSFSAKEIQLKILPGPTLMNTMFMLQVHEHELRDFPVEPRFSTGELDGWKGQQTHIQIPSKTKDLRGSCPCK